MASFHALRHTWASHRVMAGAPLMVVAHALGHADTRMVEKHYGHLAPSYIRDVTLAIARTLFEEFREPGDAPAPMLEHLVRAGYLGRKTGRGFRDSRR